MENTTLCTEWAAPLAADIAAARSEVLITSLSLQPRRAATDHPITRLWSALAAAADAGALVTFILPTPHRAHPATQFNHAAARDLFEIGVRALFAPPANLLHAKTCAIDNRIAWVGSGNWTAAASAHNREAYIRAESPALAEKLRDHWRAIGILEP